MAKTQRFDSLQHSVQFPGGDAAQIVRWSGERIQLAASSSSSAGVALPTGTKVVEIRATEDCYIEFGTGTGIAALANEGSVLFLRGVQVVPVPLDASNNPLTHVAVIAAGADDGVVQIEKII